MRVAGSWASGGARFPPSTDRIPVSGTVPGGLVKRLFGHL